MSFLLEYDCVMWTDGLAGHGVLLHLLLRSAGLGWGQTFGAPASLRLLASMHIDDLCPVLMLSRIFLLCTPLYDCARDKSESI